MYECVLAKKLLKGEVMRVFVAVGSNSRNGRYELRGALEKRKGEAEGEAWRVCRHLTSKGSGVEKIATMNGRCDDRRGAMWTCDEL